MAAGADPRLVNAGGEAPAHIVVQVFNSVFDVFEESRRRRALIVAQIQDIQMMACFLDFLSKEDLNIKVSGNQRKVKKIQQIYFLKDSFGDSLLHYVAAAMDEDAIFKVLQWEIYSNLHFCNGSNRNGVICPGDVVNYFG